jgi:hypothetical protein
MIKVTTSTKRVNHPKYQTRKKKALLSPGGCPVEVEKKNQLEINAAGWKQQNMKMKMKIKRVHA